MMKRLYMLGMILLTGQIAMAQYSHNFILERAKLTELHNPTDLLDRGLLDDLTGTDMPIGFEFMFEDNTPVDRLRFTEDGVLEGYHSNDGKGVFTLSLLQDTDLLDRGFQSGITESSVSSSLIDLAGEKKFVVQWLNVGFQKEYDEYQTSGDFANFQLTLSERDHLIEFTYGQSNVNRPQLYFGSSGPVVGNASVKLETQQYLVNQSNNPSTTTNFGNLDNFPVIGASYTFTQGAYSTPQVIEEKLVSVPKLNAKVYPNPFTNEFTITLQPGIPPVKVLVTSPYGKVVHEGVLSNMITLDLTGFDQGMYLIRLISKNDMKVLKALKR